LLPDGISSGLEAAGARQLSPALPAYVRLVLGCVLGLRLRLAAEKGESCGDREPVAARHSR